MRSSGLLLLFCLALSACARLGGGSSPDSVILDLRKERDDLKGQVAELEAKLDRRTAELARLRKTKGLDTSRVPGVTQADLPKVTTLKIGRLSGLLDRSGDGEPDKLRIYLETLDQNGRFLATPGLAVIKVVEPRGDEESRMLGRVSLTAKELDRTFRQALGTHYTIEISIQAPRKQTRQLSVEASFTDAATGVQHTLLHVIEL